MFRSYMITLQDLLVYLQDLLSPEAHTDYCPNGIQVEGKRDIKRICFAVSASLAAIDEAIKRGADALITHHGIFWNKDPHLITSNKREKLKRLLTHDLSLLTYHLPLDAHWRFGNNWKAAIDLGIKNLVPFSTIGVRGNFPKMHVDEFRKKLEAYYGHSAHIALGGKEEVASAIIVSGNAHRYIENAADLRVDCFITGSFDEPVWDIAHERKINFFALGHYSTERVGPLALMAEVHKHFQVPCEFIDLFNPF